MSVDNRQMSVWDFTLSQQFCKDEKLVIDILESLAKKWGFQSEKSETGYLHYQGRMSLIKRKRKGELLNLVKDTVLEKASFSMTSKNCADDKDIYHYTTKLDTRIDGPWRDDQKPKFMTRQLKEFINYELYPYQQSIIDICNTVDNRKINLIYDVEGSQGKSMLGEYLEHMELAEEIPPYNCMEDIMGWVMEYPNKKCYLIDMPRAMKKDKLGQFYSGLEALKDGKAYDKRYKARKVRFDRPQIVIYSNNLPDFELLTKNRWVIWTIDENLELIDYFEHEKKKMELLVEQQTPHNDETESLFTDSTSEEDED